MKIFFLISLLLLSAGCDRLLNWSDFLDDGDGTGKLGAGGEPSPPPPPSPSTTPDGRSSFPS